jgi:hypothetical protein
MKSKEVYLQQTPILEALKLSDDVITEHYSESGAIDKGRVLSPDVDSYMTLERLDKLKTLVAFTEGKAIGYCAILLYRPTHYDMVAASVDALWLSVEHRSTTNAGFKLLKGAEEIAKNAGAQMLSISAQANNPKYRKFLRLTGYNEDYVVHTKTLR